MPIAVKPYTDEFIPAVRELNRRLSQGGISSDFAFPETPITAWLPKANGHRTYQETFIATDGGQVRGGFIVKHQDFSINGDIQRIAFYRLPISEGIINRAYMSVGVHMVRSALQQNPKMFALGMGGFDRPLPQMLKALGWTLTPVPFFFRVNHPAKFLRNVAPLRRDATRRFLSNAAALSGFGWIGIKAMHRVRTRGRATSASVELVPRFENFADEIWNSCRSEYQMIGCRDAETLNLLYGTEEKYLRLKVKKDRQTIGWAIVLDTQMRSNKYFGDLRVGSIADCLGRTEHACEIIRATIRYLQQRGVDLIISNQSHSSWCNALGAGGFLEAPTNFIFASSKALAEQIGPLPHSLSKIHLNRGDGDGPVNL